MAKKPLPSPEVLRQLLRYEPDTGKLFWKERGPEWFASKSKCDYWNSVYSGKETFSSVSQSGYRKGVVCGLSLRSSRVCWAIFYGAWPRDIIDHKNCDRGDDRISNLREATFTQNAANKTVSMRSRSGAKGVSWSKRDRVWRAYIGRCGKKIYLGSFNNIDAAKVAYNEAAREQFGEFAKE